MLQFYYKGYELDSDQYMFFSYMENLDLRVCCIRDKTRKRIVRRDEELLKEGRKRGMKSVIKQKRVK